MLPSALLYPLALWNKLIEPCRPNKEVKEDTIPTETTQSLKRELVIPNALKPGS